MSRRLSAALTCLACIACASSGAQAPAPAAPPASSAPATSTAVAPTQVPAHPPAVLLGEASLDCTMDARANGAQKLAITRGGGVEFEAVVSPMVDGTVSLKGPDKGGAYRFTSHLAQPTRGKLAGVGEVEIEELEAKVTVELKRYVQPGGPGTPISFRSRDMATQGIYVEFVGRAKAGNGDRYAFRVNLGAMKAGSGKVEPADPNYDTRMIAKSVVLEAPLTTVVESSVPAATSVRKLP